MNDIWSLTNGGNYEDEQAERLRWFNKIKPAVSWKFSIDTWIDETDLENCSQACIWFTGSELTVVEKVDGKVHVTAPGYYATVGA